MVKPRIHISVRDDHVVGDVALLSFYPLSLSLKGGRVFPRGFNAINCYAINNAAVSSEETGSSPKWVTRFQLLAFFC